VADPESPHTGHYVVFGDCCVNLKLVCIGKNGTLLKR
jgi:hypothetical protein